MEKQIRAYEEFIRRELEELNRRRNETTGFCESVEQLRKLHAQRLRDIQQERLAHLFIMLFFGGMALLFFAISLLGTEPLLWVLTLLAVVVECFYIKHYFFLENHLQALYPVELELYQLIKTRQADTSADTD